MDKTPTPKPWKVGTNLNGEPLIFSGLPHDPNLIAKVFVLELKDGQGHPKANAHLIAAALDLLEVAQKVVRHFEFISNTKERVFEDWETDLWQSAEDAIKKSTGQEEVKKS